MYMSLSIPVLTYFGSDHGNGVPSLVDTLPTSARVLHTLPLSISNSSIKLCKSTGRVNFSPPSGARSSTFPTYSTNSPVSPHSKCYRNMSFAFITASLLQPIIRLSPIHEIMTTNPKGVQLKYMQGSALESFVPTFFTAIRSSLQNAATACFNPYIARNSSRTKLNAKYSSHSLGRDFYIYLFTVFKLTMQNRALYIYHFYYPR